jgi:CRISPR/Cas system CSM-associated protein Csm4 (group 5 of RAMP superfamily)
MSGLAISGYVKIEELVCDQIELISTQYAITTARMSLHLQQSCESWIGGVQSAGFGEFSETFSSNDVDGDVLLHLTNQVNMRENRYYYVVITSFIPHYSK